VVDATSVDAVEELTSLVVDIVEIAGVEVETVEIVEVTVESVLVEPSCN
jgi:hypothetical protein